MAGSIFIPLISVFDGKGVSQAKTGLSAIAGAVKGLKGAAVAAAASMATVGALGFVKDSVTSARDLERNMVGLNGVFGNLTPTMTQFSKDAQEIGLSQVEASRASTFLGSVLKQSGFTMEDTAEQTKNLVGLASDLAATYGYEVSEALTGMTALFRGEYDPIEKFGVAMKQAEVNALLAARGQKGLTGEALRNAQAQARLDLLYSRSQDAQGAYALQADSLFVAQKNLAASFENMKSSLGASLTGPLASLLASVQPLVEAIGEGLAPYFERLSTVVEMLTPLIEPLMEMFFVLNEAIQPVLDVLLELIRPLLVPLISIVKMLTTVFKPLVPVIQIVAEVIGAVLIPVINTISFVINSVIGAVIALFDAVASIPGLGDTFKAVADTFHKTYQQITGLTDKLQETNLAKTKLDKNLSKKLPVPDINGTNTALEKVVQKSKEAADKINKYLTDALNIQKGILDVANLATLFQDTSSEVVESIVYVNGKFKTVVRSVSGASKDLGKSFKGVLNEIKSFSTNITKLDALNLDSDLLQQIVSAGPEAGNAIAESILASGEDGVTALNDTWASIKRVSGNIGATVGATMQTTGSEIGNGLIDGIQATADRLNAVATAMGDKFAASFNNGIKVNATKTTEEILAGAVTATNALRDQIYSTMPGPITVAPMAIKNPYDKVKNPAAYNLFERAKASANTYNITVNVPYGASDAAIGAALITKLQAYEKTRGSSWRKD
jgi:phage-related protein